MIEFKPEKSSKEESFRLPSSFEFTFDCILSDDSPLLKWIKEAPDPKKTLKQVEEYMKKYDITPDRMVSDRSTLNWLFLSDNILKQESIE